MPRTRPKIKTQAKTFVMKVTLPTLNETQHQVARYFAAAVEKDSGGRIDPCLFLIAKCLPGNVT